MAWTTVAKPHWHQRHFTRASSVPVPNGSHALVVGDSWGLLSAAALQEAVAPLGLDVRNRGGEASFGLTACALATAIERPGYLFASQIQSVAYVWLSSGGNDLVASYRNRKPSAGGGASGAVSGADPLERLGGCVRRVLLRLFALQPSLQVVQFSYEVLCASKTSPIQALARSECEPSGPGEANTSSSHGSGGGGGGGGGRGEEATAAVTSCYNSGVARVHATLAAMRHRMATGGELRAIEARGGSYTLLNLQGTLQAAGGVDRAWTGTPRLDAYTPRKFFLGDCMHLSLEGQRAVMRAFVGAYWRPRVDEAAALSARDTRL